MLRKKAKKRKKSRRKPSRLLQWLFGANLPIFRATANNVAGLCTYFVESGIIDPKTGMKAVGMPVGWCGEDRSGGAMPLDPFELQRIFGGMFNVIVLGEGGMRKSSSLKWLMYLASKMGYRFIVTDVKGEYIHMDELIPDMRIVRFGPDTDQHINVFDTMLDKDTQKKILTSMVLITMGAGKQHLELLEERVLWRAVVEVKNQAAKDGRVPVLPDLVKLMFAEPTEAMIRSLRLSKEQIMDIAHPMASGLMRLTADPDSETGEPDEFNDLFGMFHTVTTPGLFDPASLIVFDLSVLKGDAVKLAVTFVNFFSQDLAGQTGHRYHFLVLDENWKFMNDPEHVESLVASEKLGGTTGTSVIVVFHALSDAYLSGNEAAVEAIVAASQIKIIFRQTEANVKDSKAKLQLTDEEAAVIPTLEEGHAMLKVGNRRGILIEFDPTDEVVPFLETRGLSHGKDSAFAKDEGRLAS